MQIWRHAHRYHWHGGAFKSIVDLQAAINRYLGGASAGPRPFRRTAHPHRLLAAVERGQEMLESIHRRIECRFGRGDAIRLEGKTGVTPVKPISYRPDIDGLRAVAVLSVMAYHLDSAFLPGGFVGVDVFFVISGFVVTGSLLDSGARTVLGFIGEFYARRLARIIPALVVALIASAVLATMFIPPAWLSELSESTAKGAFLGFSNWVLMRNSDTYFAPRAEFNAYTHTWSLGVEEQFYILAPFLVYFWIRARRNSSEVGGQLAVGGLAAMIAASLAASIWASAAFPTEAFYFVGFRLWELGLGTILFLLSWKQPQPADRPIASMWVGQITGGLGLAAIAAGLVLADASRFPWPWALLPTVGTILLIGGAGRPPGGAVRHILAAPLAVWIGKRSYSLYLWHWPIYVLLRWTVGLETVATCAAAVVMTFALSALSYRWVETPWRHHRWIEHQPIWARIAVFALMPIVGVLIVTAVFENRQAVTLSKVALAPDDWYVGARMPYPNFGRRQCRVDIEWPLVGGGQGLRYVPKDCRGELSHKAMFVLGDSHALALAPMLEQLSAERGMPISLFSGPSCGYIALRQPMANETPECLAFSRAVTDHVLAVSRPGDIVLLESARLIRFGDEWSGSSISDMYEQMYNPYAAILRKAAEVDASEWLRRFAEKKLEVVFVAPPPEFKAPPFRCSDWFNAMNPICVGRNQQSRNELESLRKPIVDTMASLAKAFPNVRIWDPFPILCPKDICSAQHDGRPLFFDGDHLSGYGNMLMYPYFASAIASIP
jgi:peptidoglycan/LPS O-acetylase OafA/YrhL